MAIGNLCYGVPRPAYRIRALLAPVPSPVQPKLLSTPNKLNNASTMSYIAAVYWQHFVLNPSSD